MKSLLFLLLSLSTFAQGNDTILIDYVGTWQNASRTDTLIITEQNIRWNSNDNQTFVSYVDFITHNTSMYFVFNSQPSVFILSIEKISRIKIIFFAQTLEGLERKNDTFFKVTRRVRE
jgi:hypothetical protein